MKLKIFAMGVALAIHGTVASAQAWPSKPIRLIIGYPPGGGADAVARPIADVLSKQLGQPIIVENKPGAGTTIAASAAAAATPDGYTLYMGSSGQYGSLRAVFKDFKYSGKDYTPISRWTVAPMIAAVSTELGVKSVPELIALAKSKPGQLNYASSGIGGPPHLAGLYFAREAGLDMVHVPYKGGAQALQGVVGGETQLTFGTPPSVLPLARAGRLRTIALTSEDRSPLFPDLPTVSEGGLKGFDFTFWFGLFGPAGLPQEIVARLFEASTKALEDPAVREKLAASGNEARPSASPAEFAAWAEKDGARVLELIVQSGAKAD